MKRDMNLVREILKWGSDQPHGTLNGNPQLEGYTEEQIGYHVYLMDQAGLVKAAIRDGIGLPSPTGLLYEITWDGHEFNALAANDALWKKAGTTILKEGAAFTFDLLKEYLKAEAAKVGWL